MIHVTSGMVHREAVYALRECDPVRRERRDTAAMDLFHAVHALRPGAPRG